MAALAVAADVRAAAPSNASSAHSNPVDADLETPRGPGGGEGGEDGEGSLQQAPSHFAESEFFFLSSHNCVHCFSCFSPLHHFFTWVRG